MNSKSIHVSDNATNIGTQIVSKSEALVDLIKKVEGVNTEIQEAWAGKDATNYSERLTQQCNEIENLFQTAILIGNVLKSAVQDYEEAQNANSTYVA